MVKLVCNVHIEGCAVNSKVKRGVKHRTCSVGEARAAAAGKSHHNFACNSNGANCVAESIGDKNRVTCCIDGDTAWVGKHGSTAYTIDHAGRSASWKAAASKNSYKHGRDAYHSDQVVIPIRNKKAASNATCGDTERVREECRRA